MPPRDDQLTGTDLVPVPVQADREWTMPSGRFLGNLMGTFFDRTWLGRSADDDRSIEDLCGALLREKAEVSTQQIAVEALARYRGFGADEKATFFAYLNDRLDVDAAKVAEAARRYGEEGGVRAFAKLQRHAEPKRQELLRRLNQAPGATGELVKMRCDLLAMIRAQPVLARADHDFAHLLRNWFNRGFLVLRQINWNSPAAILEKIIAYEAVHAINTWDDLRRRVQPLDRRCFAFFHPSMPDEPLIFVEVALTKEVPGSIRDLLSEDRPIIGEDEARTAVFYSISNCQAGLAGISFGNSLIKQVAHDLSIELPHLKTFVTLSPIPGLMRWLKSEGKSDIADDPAALQRWAALYLLDARRKDGTPRDSVARFHLGNGAQILRVHAEADPSPKGLAQSGGVMVNYLYDIPQIAQNHEAFISRQEIAASSEVRGLSRRAKRKEKSV